MSRPHRWRRTALAVALTAAAASLAIAGPATAAPVTPDSSKGPGCVRTLPAGTSQVTVTSQGAAYSVRVHVPQTNSRTAVPLVLDLHGSNNNGDLQAMVSGFDALSDAQGFIVAEPNGAVDYGVVPGVGQAYAWNVPGVPTTAGSYPTAGTRNDVVFLTDVVKAISTAGCIDSHRVYAAGYSGGARMASALACAEPGLLAAIAPVDGLRAGRPDPANPTRIDTATCLPKRPVPVITFHGTDDTVNPYLGNASDLRWGYPVLAAAKRWAALDLCWPQPRTKAVSAHVTLTSWSLCLGGDVEMYTVTGGGHTWPGSSVPMGDFGLGSMTTEINASTLIWDFFAAHPRRI